MDAREEVCTHCGFTEMAHPISYCLLYMAPATGEVRQEKQTEMADLTQPHEMDWSLDRDQRNRAPLPDPASNAAEPSKPLAGLWRNNPETPEGKYLVKRRDGSVVEWPNFVLGAKDPAAPDALLAYAEKARELGMNPEFCDDVVWLAKSFELYRIQHGDGDPDRGRHRKDDAATIAEMRGKGQSAPSTPVGPPQAQEFVKECMYCGGSPDHKHGQGHACGDCCGSHGAMSTDTEDYNFVERMRVCSFNRLVSLLETRAALDAATKERDEFERKGKDLCQAYGNSLMNIDHITRELAAAQAQIAELTK